MYIYSYAVQNNGHLLEGTHRLKVCYKKFTYKSYERARWRGLEVSSTPAELWDARSNPASVQGGSF
jgi:hypothetical protein